MVTTTFTVTAPINIEIDIEILADSIEDIVFEEVEEKVYCEKVSKCAEAFFPAVMASVIAELTRRHKERCAV